MATLEIKDKKGKKVGTLDVAKAIAEAKAPDAVLHRTVVAEMANARQGTQAAKTRSEVKGGGQKPYKQKKTGRARQGSIRAPQYAHGGMALAVKPRDYDKKVNKKERRAAILSALQSKIEDGSLVAVDAITFASPKTKEAADMLKALDLNQVKRLLVVLPAYDEVALKCFRNLPNVTVKTAPANGKDKEGKTEVFSARDLLVAHKVLIAKDAMAKIEEVWAK
jgi:large subunit ribosomal protein L4